jgi:O-antigen/teichoic acid export membrane protein
LGTIVSQAVGFLLLPFYTKYLTPSDYGIMSLINVTMDLVGLMFGLGIVAAISRFYFDYDSRREQNRVVSTAYWIYALAVVIFYPPLYFCSSLFANLLFDSQTYASYFIVASLALIFGVNVDIGLAHLRITNQSTKYVVISICRTFSLILFNIYFIGFAKTGVIGIFYSSLINKIIFSLLLTVTRLRIVKLGFSMEVAREMVKFSLPLIFSDLFRVLGYESDKYFINHFFSSFETGILTLAQKIGTATHMLITSPFIRTFMPRRFEIMKTEDAEEKYVSILHFYLLIICSASLALSLFSTEIIYLMTTSRFHVAARYIPLVSLSMIFLGLKYHFETGILIKKKTKFIAMINGFTAFSNIIINYFMIKNYGLYGAIIAINISYLTNSLLNLLFSQKLFHINYNFSNAAAIIVMTVLSYVIFLIIGADSMILNIIYKIGIMALYVSGLYFSGLLFPDKYHSAKFLLLNRQKNIP